MTDIWKGLAALAFMMGALGVSACSNTMEGAGQDIRNAGHEIEETAEETHDDDPTTP